MTIRKGFGALVGVMFFINGVVQSAPIQPMPQYHYQNQYRPPTTAVAQPYVPGFKYYRLGSSQNKIYKGFFFKKLNPKFVNEINSVPEAGQELETYRQVEKEVGLWKTASLISFGASLGGLLYVANNIDSTDIRSSGDGTMEFYDDPAIQKRERTGWIIAGVGLVTGLTCLLVAAAKGSDQDQNMLNAVNAYNEHSEKAIELIISSSRDNPNEIGLTLVKKF